MRDEQVYVIKNKDGYYLNANYGVLFSGVTSGFIFYNNTDTLRRDLERLGEGYHSEHVNFSELPNGKRIYTT